MSRIFFTTAIIALIASADRCLAQAWSSLPVIQPRVAQLGEIRDTALFLTLIPQEASLSPRGTLTAYIDSHDDLRIWSVRTHANHVVVGGWSQKVVWSPAGDAIAFVHWDQGSHRIWMLGLNPVTGEAIESPQRVSLRTTNDVAPQFSPDGKSIAFSRQDSGEHSSLAVVLAAGGLERVLASGDGIRELRWAADGSAMYYVSYSDAAKGNAMLYRVAVNGGAAQLVHDFAGESRAPTLSADNRVVALATEVVGAEQAVRIGDLNGRPLVSLSMPAGVQVGDWTGEYRQVGFRPTMPRGLRVVNVANGKSRDLIDSTADVQAVTWFEDNRRIAAIVFYGGTGALVTINADGTGLRKMRLAVQPFRSATVHGFAVPLRVSPDGRYAVYQGPGHRSLELVNLLTGKQRTLTRAQNVGPPWWHADSRTIRYMRFEEVPLVDPGWRGVHDVSLDGNDKVVRTFPMSQYPNTPFMVDKDHVTIFGGNTFSLARLDGSTDQLLTQGSTTRWPGVISADGLTLAVSPGPIWSNTPSRKVTLYSLSDGSQRSIDLPFSDIDCVTFSPEGCYLYCRGREADSGPQTLYEVPVDGSKPRVVTRIDSREFMGASVLSPDGKWLLQTVAGVRRAAFVSLDFTGGMRQLLSSPAKR